MSNAGVDSSVVAYVRGGGGGLVANALVEQLEEVECWCMMATQRCVVPIYG